MSFIRTKQWEKINEIVYSINEKTKLAQLREDFLRQLTTIIPYKCAIFDLGRVYNTRIQYFLPVSKNIGEEYLADYYRKFKWAEPSLFFFSRSNSNVFRESDFINEKNRFKDLFYLNWMCPQDIHFAMSTNISYEGVYFGSINLWRDQEASDFSDNEMEMLATLNEHLSLWFYRFYPNGVSKECCNEGTDDFAMRYNLTSRESTVAQMIGSGKDVAEIADALYISESTVNKHLYSIFRKLQINTRTELVRLYLGYKETDGADTNYNVAGEE
jgi:DNA-binding CsgD family transcriptional regulator